MVPCLVFALDLAFTRLGDDAAAPPKQNWFEPPLRVAAGGKPIDHAAQGGHCGPTLRDVDGDGLRDLVIGDASGRFTVYRNVGGARTPEFAAGVRMRIFDAGSAAGSAGATVAEARVPAGGALGPLGSSPRLVDFDGDGTLDLVSGGVDPPAFWLFPAFDPGAFEKPREIVGSDGKPLRIADAVASALDLVDWDDDGDLDLIGGSVGGERDGELVVFLNEGTRTTPSYAAIPAPIPLTDGARARVPGGGAAVVAADWDGDGLFDLVGGSASGAVVWFRNVGVRVRPLFTTPETLVPAVPVDRHGVWLEPGAEPRPGRCAQLDVVDWNGDGRLDLLVGDFCTTVSPREGLTDEQKRAVASLRLQRDSADLDLARPREKLDLELAKFLQKAPGRPGPDDWQQPHGWVWLYVRKD